MTQLSEGLRNMKRSTEATHLQLSLDAALAKIRELMTELAEVKAHYRMSEAELAMAKARYIEAEAKVGADRDTDLSTKADEEWLRAREEAA